jgi:hypothetical protein
MVVTDVRAGGQQASRFTPLTPVGDSMIRLAYSQRSLVPSGTVRRTGE